MRKHNDLSIMKQLFYISLAALMLLSISCNKDDKYGVDGMTPLPEAVDLGLPSGLKWSSFNLGASKEYKCGDYYVFLGGTHYISQNPLTWKDGYRSGYGMYKCGIAPITNSRSIVL